MTKLELRMKWELRREARAEVDTLATAQEAWRRVWEQAMRSGYRDSDCEASDVLANGVKVARLSSRGHAFAPARGSVKEIVTPDEPTLEIVERAARELIEKL